MKSVKAGSYEVVLKKARTKYMPKKVLRYAKIPVNDHYTFNASIWVADTRESNFRPSVNLTLDHNGNKIRFCFQNVPEMILAIEELRQFIGINTMTVDEKHRLALREWLDFHEAEKQIPINDYTVYTVIQEKRRKGKLKKTVCNTETGEILEETEVEADKFNATEVKGYDSRSSNQTAS